MFFRGDAFDRERDENDGEARQEAARAWRGSMRAEPGSPLAKARIAAHSAFDPVWQNGKMTRSEAYTWLAHQLKIPKERCHMLQFDIATCERVVEVCSAAGFGLLDFGLLDFEVLK